MTSSRKLVNSTAHPCPGGLYPLEAAAEPLITQSHCNGTTSPTKFIATRHDSLIIS